MEDFLAAVITHEPRHKSDVFFAPAHLMLSIQYQGAEQQIAAALRRLETDSDTTVCDTLCILLNLTVSNPSLNPDVIDKAVEQVCAFGAAHPSYRDGMRWICGFLHYQCSNELAVGVMSEVGAIELATKLLEDSVDDARAVAAACALLAHFNCYNVGNAVELITRGLIRHSTNHTAAGTACRALAEFTSFWGGSSDVPAKYAQQFVESGGLPALLQAMQSFAEDESLQLSCCRVFSNVGSGEHVAAMASKPCCLALAAAALRFPLDEMLVSHALHALANIPLDTEHYDKSLVDATLVAIKNYAKSELIQTEATRVCGTLATLVKDSKSHIAEKGAIPLIIAGLQAHPDAAMLHQEACNVFSYLAFDSEPITGAITKAGGIQIVLRAMQRFAGNESLLTTACAAVSGLTFNNAAGQLLVLENNGIAIVLQAMKNSSRERLLEMGCLALGTMCWNGDLKAEVVAKGGIDGILSAMTRKKESPAVVKNALRALAQIAFNSEQFRDEMSRKGAIPSIIEVMKLHAQHDRVQMHGCVALSYLSWTNERNATEIASLGGYSIIVAAMKNHSANAEVQEHACRALANISHVMTESADEAIETMIQGMKRHERVAEVQEEACRAIVTLSLVTTANKDRLFAKGAPERVVAALRNFPRNHVVQQEGCNALAHLAYEHGALNRQVTELGGIDLLLHAMRNFPNHVKVQLNACGGLSALAFDNPTAQRQIYDSDGVTTVIHAMRTFDKLRILELGCSVLGTLAWNPEIKEKVAVIAIPEILRSMRAHADNGLLQKSTCRAISQFAFNSEANRQLLYEAKAIPHIVTAMKSHIDTEKLISHAIVALTYLCWENAEVAQSIIDEGTIEVLHKIEVQYKDREKIANKATHLLKILGRKVTPQASPMIVSPTQKEGGRLSTLQQPPPDSPTPVGRRAAPSATATPAAPPSPSPAMRDRDELDFFAYRTEVPAQKPPRVTSKQIESLRSTPPPAAQSAEQQRGRGGGRGRGAGRGGERGGRGEGQRGRYRDPREAPSNEVVEDRRHEEGRVPRFYDQPRQKEPVGQPEDAQRRPERRDDRRDDERHGSGDRQPQQREYRQDRRGEDDRYQDRRNTDRRVEQQPTQYRGGDRGERGPPREQPYARSNNAPRRSERDNTRDDRDYGRGDDDRYQRRDRDDDRQRARPANNYRDRRDDYREPPSDDRRDREPRGGGQNRGGGRGHRGGERDRRQEGPRQ